MSSAKESSSLQRKPNQLPPITKGQLKIPESRANSVLQPKPMSQQDHISRYPNSSMLTSSRHLSAAVNTNPSMSHPLEVSAVASAANAFWNPNSRVICRRYSIDVPVVNTNNSCSLQRNLHVPECRPFGTVIPNALDKKGVVLPPINAELPNNFSSSKLAGGISTSEDINQMCFSDSHCDETSRANYEVNMPAQKGEVKYRIVLKKTPFSKAYIKVPITGNDGQCNITQSKGKQSLYNERARFDHLKFSRKLSRTPGLPVISELEVSENEHIDSELEDENKTENQDYTHTLESDSDTDSRANNAPDSPIDEELLHNKLIRGAGNNDTCLREPLNENEGLITNLEDYRDVPLVYECVDKYYRTKCYVDQLNKDSSIIVTNANNTNISKRFFKGFHSKLTSLFHS